MTTRSLCAVASALGQSHKKSAAPLQDYGLVEKSEDGCRIIGAVADGAGSAARSDQGAKQICTFALNALKEQADELLGTDQCGTDVEAILRTIYQNTQNNLQAYAEEKEIPLHELAATLVAFAASPDRIASIEVGDSFLITKQQASDDFRLVSPPTRGEFANSTVFITHDPDGCFVRLNCSENFPADNPLEFIAAMTDGLESVAIHKQNNMPGGIFFQPLLNACHQLETDDALADYIRQVINLPTLDRRTDDDKTLLLACFRQ